MKRRIAFALAAAALAATLAAPVAADPTWPPRPVKQVYGYCLQSKSVSGCITLPRVLGKWTDNKLGLQRVCHAPGGCR